MSKLKVPIIEDLDQAKSFCQDLANTMKSDELNGDELMKMLSEYSAQLLKIDTAKMQDSEAWPSKWEVYS